MPRAKMKYKNVWGGTLLKRTDGRLEYRIRFKDSYGRKRVKSFYGMTEDECLDKVEAYGDKLEKIMRGIDVDSTVPQIVKHKYEIDLAKNYVGEQGYCRNLATLGIIERSTIGRIPVADLTEDHINCFLGTITRYSNSVIGKIYQQLHLAFNIARDKEIIDKNIMKSTDLRCPKSDKRNKKVRGLTEEEQKIFVERLKNHRVPRGRNDYKLQLFIELYSGMRMGEINALRPEDVDLENKVVHIRRTVSRGIEYRPFIKEGTKTYAGMRDIPINKQLEPILREALEKKRKNKEGLIFYDYNKKGLVETTQVNCLFKRICNSCGVEYNGQHALRHTFATRCIEAGIPPIVLKKWLGHKNIHITLDTYADVFDRMNFDAVDKFDAYIEAFDEKQEEI